jgi:hypothetical protein
MSTGGSLGAATFTVTANTAGFVQGMQQAQQQAQRSTQAIAATIQQAGRASEQQWKGMAMGAMQVGQAVDDLQYGFRAIVNNIQTMGMSAAQAFGASTTAAMAFGGAASVVAVGVNLLINHWGELTDAMQAAWSGSTIEQLTMIREKAEAAAEAFDKLAKAPTKAQAAGEKALAEAIVEGPTGKVLEGVLAGVINDPTLRAEMTEQERRDLEAPAARFGAPGAIPEARAGRAGVQKRIDEDNRKKAAGLIGAATKGDATAIATLRRMANANPGAFPPGFLADLDEMDPAVRAQQEKIEREGALRGGNLQNEDRQREAARKKKEKNDKLVDQLNQQGQENFQIGEREAEQERKKDAREAEKDAREAERDARKRRHLGWQVQDITKAARPERAKAQFQGFAEFAKSTQLGILNNPVDIAKKQLEALERIRRLLEDNPDMKNVINQAAIAAGPP